MYFAKEHFKTAIPLAITSMLVMYTLKGSVSSKLPPTSYVKFIDIWLLYGLLIPFFILILLVLIEHLPQESSSMVFVRSGEKERKKNTVYNQSKFVKTIGRTILPCMQISFVLVYFLVAFNKHNAQ